jgi:hypothetical protein
MTDAEGKEIPAELLESKARLDSKTKEVHNTLLKLRREACGFINQKDKDNVKEFVDNARLYLQEWDMFAIAKLIFDKRQEDLKAREN